MQLGFYAQDKIQLTPNITTTFGLRADIPIINADIARNEEATA
jgi:outer membrane receptor protein involved in Fe transport